MPAFKKDLLDGIVYSAHFDRLPPVIAHKKLMVMTGGADTYTLQDVEKLYEKIEKGEFSLMEEIDWVNKFPAHLSREVVGMLDFPARASLRKTCHFFRNLVDTGRMSIEQLVIVLEATEIEISSGDKFYFKYYEGQDNTYTVSQYRSRHRLDGNFITAAMTDLKTLIGNSKLVIDELKVSKIGRSDETYNAMLEVLNSLKHKLKVVTLELDAVERLQDILPYVDEKTIQTIVTTGESSGIYLPGAEIFNLPQWKKATNLKLINCEFNPNDFVELAHFEKVRMSVKDRMVTVEQVMALKDKLLENPKLQEIHIFHVLDWSEGVFEALDTSLFQFKHSPASRYAHFHYPGTGKKLGLRITKNYIRFRGPCCLDSEDAKYLGDE